MTTQAASNKEDATMHTDESVLVNIKAGGSITLIDIKGCETVRDLKVKILEEKQIKTDQQKLLFKGRMLGDDDLLSSRKIEAGATIFLVKGADKSSSSTAPVVEEPKKEEETQAPMPCAGKCGFYGNPKMDNMCSKCFKAKQDKEAEDFKKTLQKQEEKEQSKEEKKEDDDDKKEEKTRPVQENKTRCWNCNKKCGLTGIECRCGYVFCAMHRLPEAHNCDFDYKTCGRELLRKQNEKVEADKLGDRA